MTYPMVTVRTTSKSVLARPADPDVDVTVSPVVGSDHEWKATYHPSAWEIDTERAVIRIVYENVSLSDEAESDRGNWRVFIPLEHVTAIEEEH